MSMNRSSIIITLLLVTNWASPTIGESSLPISSLQDDLAYDASSKLVSHQLVYTAGCAPYVSTTHKPDLFEFHEVQGKARSDLFGEETTGECQAACIERGVDQALVAAMMPHKFYSPADNGDLSIWLRDVCSRVEVCVMNYIDPDNALQLYWINGSERIHHLDVEYGERKTRCFSSYIGHKFEADSQSGNVLGGFTVEFVTMLAFGKAPTLVKPTEDKSQQIRSTLHHEWKRHHRVTRTFSPLGFAKGRLPDDVFASMGAFYYNNRNNKVNEEWQGKGVFVNWWETDVSFIQIPWGMKALWQQRLKELVEAWAGVPIEETDLYGLRQYESGARLVTHVDRERTHGVSLIVNIAQGNLTEPWPVEVHDHKDRLHEVIMAPGDVVYYESAKCLHGRNRPLAGPNAYYVNLFTHYRPVGDDQWFTKPNHEGSPEPVLDVHGECRLEASGLTKASPTGQLGIIQTVTCDDPRLGPYVSPALFTATSGDDLFDWWVRVGPKTAAKSDVKDEL